MSHCHVIYSFLKKKKPRAGGFKLPHALFFLFSKSKRNRMRIFQKIGIIAILLCFGMNAIAQDVDKQNSYRRSFTFGLNNSAFMSKVNGQVNDFFYSGTPYYRQGLHIGYSFLTRRYGLFEIEYGAELNHLTLRSTRVMKTLTNDYYYRMFDENNVLTFDINTKLFVSPVKQSKYRFFCGYRMSLPFTEFFWRDRFYMQDDIFDGLLKYYYRPNEFGGRFADVNYINHYILFGTDFKINDRWVIEANFNTMLGIWLTEQKALPPLNYNVERYITNFQIIAKYKFKSRKQQ